MTHMNLSTVPVAILVLVAVVIVIQITLDVIALRDLYKRPVSEVVFSNKWPWVAIILFANILGSILYLAAGRKREVLEYDVVSSKPSHSSNVADVLYGRHDDKDEK